MKDINKFDLYNIYNLYGGNLLVCYKGPFDEYMMCSMGNYIKSLTQENVSVQNKMYKIYMELAQNVSFYSYEYKEFEDKKIGIGSLSVFEKDKSFYFHIGNIVRNEYIYPIIDKSEIINSMDRDKLREYKRKERAKPYSEFGGGNIGLIQVALSSKNPLDIKLTPINDTISFFSICVKIQME